MVEDDKRPPKKISNRERREERKRIRTLATREYWVTG